jgi:hypothetical protein
LIPEAREVLAATGYLTRDGRSSEGLVLPGDARRAAGEAARLEPLLSPERGGLSADAVFRVGTSPVIIFKSSPEPTTAESEWHRTAWNFGVAPLLWVTTPQYVRLYNAYHPPADFEGGSPLLKEFPISEVLDRALAEIDAACGRRHVAMGSFWHSELARPIDRQKRIDNILLRELGHLLRELVRQGIRTSLAQKLVGRCIFFQYLIHRGYVTGGELAEHFGAAELSQILGDLDGTYSLFRWIKTTFNGDLFPLEIEDVEREQLGHSADRLKPLADFFGHFNVSDRQGRLFPFRFDAIPVELISSIYEKFAHLSETDGVPRRGVHYTPVNLVDLILDPVFEALPPTARVLDFACGSGVFLVESLRRLVWLHAQNEAITRELIRNTLMRQIRGVDISPAALSVAAFSLYLALLELDPAPPRGLQGLGSLRFDPLRNQVLFATSTFNPALAARIADADAGREHLFDAIVGNPPWTYSAQEKEEDRALARTRGDDSIGEDALDDGHDTGSDPDEEESLGPPHSLVNDDSERRSGTTYARLEKVPIPPRSSDWPFLWRARDFRHAATRIALVMKATPFFSLLPDTSAGRDQLLRAFPNVSLVNLSQLRTSRLFQEFDDGTGEPRERAAGPALIFFSNCLPSDKGTATAINFPWAPDFRRTGVFELPTEPAKVVSLDVVQTDPSLLKAAFFGTDRDRWLLDRLARNVHVTRFTDWLRKLGLSAGQGYQVGSKMPAAHLIDLPRVAAKDLRSARIAKTLMIFNDLTVHRARDAAIYRGPLVLLPEGRLTTAPARGRYTAAFDARDLAYNESFYGVSFHGRSPTLARAFAAVMHSSLITYQVALRGGTVGIKQTKVEPVDLENLRLPHLERLPADQIDALAAAYNQLASDSGDESSIVIALATIDDLVASAAHLTEADRELLADVGRRARAIFFETPADRGPLEASPTAEEITAYARNLCLTFNAFATEDDDLILTPDRYARFGADILIVKLLLVERNRSWPAATFLSARVDELGDEPLTSLGGGDLPYLKPAKALRLYVDRAVFIVKPARYRCFSRAAGQSDGDSIVADLMSPGFSTSETAVCA